MRLTRQVVRDYLDDRIERWAKFRDSPCSNKELHLKARQAVLVLQDVRADLLGEMAPKRGKREAGE